MQIEDLKEFAPRFLGVEPAQVPPSLYDALAEIQEAYRRGNVVFDVAAAAHVLIPHLGKIDIVARATPKAAFNVEGLKNTLEKGDMVTFAENGTKHMATYQGKGPGGMAKILITGEDQVQHTTWANISPA